MKALLIIVILFPIVTIAAYTFIMAVIMIKKEEGTISPVKLYHVYRKQICSILKSQNS